MGTVFLICAVVGGVVMLCQFILTLAGLGGDHDFGVDHVDAGVHDSGAGSHADHGSTWFFSVLSFRSMVAAIAFFGLGGLAASSNEALSRLSFPVALVAGLAAMVVVAWLMKTLGSLQSEGTARIERAVGALGSVYLTVPGLKQGAGKVTVKMQNRTMEYEAVSNEKEPLKTGTPVMVVGVVGPNTVEVGRAPE